MAQLGLVIGWILTIFLAILGAVILWLIVVGKIDLTGLISEPQGEASLSRFQFLVFTFVIAMSLVYLTLTRSPQPGYPEIPNQILALLGISGGSYVLAKGIQTSRDIGMKGTGDGGDGTNDGNGKTTRTTTTTRTDTKTDEPPAGSPSQPESDSKLG